jgi:hypothetical protein
MLKEFGPPQLLPCLEMHLLLKHETFTIPTDLRTTAQSSMSVGNGLDHQLGFSLLVLNAELQSILEENFALVNSFA